MKKSENSIGVQMYLSTKAEWTNRIPFFARYRRNYIDQIGG